MKRRHLITGALAGTLGAGLAARLIAQDDGASLPADAPEAPTVGYTLEDWRRILPPDRYDILFREQTERAGTSPLNDEKRDGTYVCAACYQPLFSSRHKYDSGTGWPSFFQPIDAEAIGTKRDYKLIWPRTEYHCSRCGGHQGHVFDDGPPPTGQRWCNNGLALEFVPEGRDLPELRG
ncbi:peptide-methionine (R)-S-oxide reductase MsrB [Wenzhouxiangella sp. XN79A]|uniref:peptide-methionine (R)-S-oxide reductase MsrB n=1 Tax=Wenzhouxiangella sp. XN79A TaxID=2724193 RepID=UPI00144ADC49|nr:peptide-methionine (R)-S-oxide reductase MsrB [Wenzhouxiangella sp. XN79A]NKI34314.1 peptide-methionine (R)-S-oxide reductase MsrB [Wenzhouxiangella sp. XN79A]